MSTKARELAELSRTIIDTSDATAITINANEEVTLADDLFLADGKLVSLGANADLSLFHDGTNNNSHIQNQTGALITTTATFVVNNAANTENMLTAYQDGAVSLYHNNVVRLATSASGVAVTGTLSATDVLTVIDGSTSAPSISNAGDSNTGIYFPADDELGFLVGGSRKVHITSSGVDIENGSLTGGAATFSGNVNINKETPVLQVTDTSSSRSLMVFADNNNSVLRASGQMMLQIGSQSAITIDTSRNSAFAGAISAAGGAANPTSTAHAAAIVTSGNYGGGFATRDTAESGWYQQSNGADWHFYHNRNVSSDTPESKRVLTFSGGGNAAFTKGVLIDAAATIAAQTNMQLALRDADSTNMRANFMVEDGLNNGRGGLAIQATEAGVTNDRDIYLQPGGGRVGILTTVPQFGLDVGGTTRIQGVLTASSSINSKDINVTASSATALGLKIQRVASGRAQMALHDENNNEMWRFGATGAGSDNFAFFDGGANVLELKAAENIVSTSGDLDVGTDNNNTTVMVSGANNIEGYLGTFGSGVSFQVARHPLTGTFSNTNMAAAAINLNASSADSQITFFTSTTNNAVPAQRMRLSKLGDLGLHAGSGVAAPTHFQNLGITSTTGSNAGWTITTNQGTFNSYGAIDVAGIRNGHVYKFAFSGNFSSGVWYQFAKRSELASYGPSTGSGSEDGFMMYFRIYSNPFLCGLGEYSASRMTNMVWISNVGSNSSQEQHFIFGPALGHAPNAGQVFPISGTGNTPYMYPFEMKIHHRFGSNDHPNSDQTFEIKFPSALTGLNPAAAGRQLLIFAYIG